MSRKVLITVLLCLACGCSRNVVPPSDSWERTTIYWQQGRWQQAASVSMQRLTNLGREEDARTFDAFLAALSSDSAPRWQDGRRWALSPEGSAELSLREGPPLRLWREETTSAGETTEIEHVIPIPIRASIPVIRSGKTACEATLSLDATDVDGDGTLLPDEPWTVSGTVRLSDILLTSDARCSGGEIISTATLSTAAGLLSSVTMEIRGFDAGAAWKQRTDAFWNESYAYSIFTPEAEELSLDMTFPEGICLRGSVELRPLREALRPLFLDSTEQQVRAAAAEASAYVHMGLYYDQDFSAPLSRVGIAATHILSRYDDYWTWQPVLVFDDGQQLSLEEFFNHVFFDDIVSQMRNFSQAWSFLVPHLLR